MFIPNFLLIIHCLTTLCANLSMYSVAITYNSMKLALLGRVLCGFGSAEVANRQLISACVSYQTMTKASALFVSVSAAGMSIGPFIAAILDMLAGRDENVDLNIHLPGSPDGSGVVLNHVTAPGFLMAFAWGLQLVSVVFLFEEPQRINNDNGDGDRSSATPKRKGAKVTTYGSVVNSKTVNDTDQSVLHDIATSLGVILSNMAFPVSSNCACSNKIYFNRWPTEEFDADFYRLLYTCLPSSSYPEKFSFHPAQ